MKILWKSNPVLDESFYHHCGSGISYRYEYDETIGHLRHGYFMQALGGEYYRRRNTIKKQYGDNNDCAMHEEAKSVCL